MATWSYTFPIGFNRTVSPGNTSWGDIQYFTPPSGITITQAKLYFTTSSFGGSAWLNIYFNQKVAGGFGAGGSGTSLSYSDIKVGKNNSLSIALTASTTTRVIISNIRLELTYSGGNPGTLTLNKTSMAAGETVKISLGKADSGITRTVRVYFGSESTHMAQVASGLSASAQSVNWEYPIARCDKMPNKTIGTIKVRVIPSDGDNVEKSMTITVPASVVPTIGDFTAELVRAGVPEDIDDYLQNKSKCLLSIAEAAGARGSSITGYAITGPQVNGKTASGTYGPFTTAGEKEFTATVTDSRGRKATQTVDINVLPYLQPVPTVYSAYRCDDEGVPDQAGTYVKIDAQMRYSPFNEDYEGLLQYRIYPKTAASGVWIGASDTIDTLVSGFSTDVSYVVDIKASDGIGSNEVSLTIPTMLTAIWFNKTKNSVGIFTMPQLENTLEVNLPRIETLRGEVLTSIGRNVLHNWDLRNPVNQRAASGAISSGNYFYDRWIRQAGTIGAELGYLALAAGGAVEQRIEGHGLAGEIVTVSARVGSDIYFVTGEFPAAVGTETLLMDDLTILLGYHANHMYARIAASEAANIQSIKLEMGKQSTLHLDAPAEYTEEELKCYRYLNIFNPVGFSGYQQGTTVYVSVPTRTRMRAIPTYVGGNLTIYDGSESTYTTSSESFAMPSGSLRIVATNSTSLTRKVIAVQSGGSIEANAEL